MGLTRLLVALVCLTAVGGARADIGAFAQCAEYLTAPGAVNYIAHYGYYDNGGTSVGVPEGPTNYFTPSSIQDHPLTTFYPGLQGDVLTLFLPVSTAASWTVNGVVGTVRPVFAATSSVSASPVCNAAFVGSTALTFSGVGTHVHQYLGQVNSGPAANPTFTFGVTALVGGSGVSVTNLTYVPNDAANPLGLRNPNSIYGDVTIVGAGGSSSVLLQLTVNGVARTDGTVSISY